MSATDGPARRAAQPQPAAGLAAALVQCRCDRPSWPLLLTTGVHVAGADG